MYSNDTRKKLENIINGIIIRGQKDNCTAARDFLCTSFSTSTTTKKQFDHQSKIKEEQSKSLKQFISENNLWVKHLPNTDRYLSEGGEVKIYLDNDNRNVIKLNDAVYYSTWLDFFNSILIHNLLFEETAYELLGFVENNDALQAILK